MSTTTTTPITEAPEAFPTTQLAPPTPVRPVGPRSVAAPAPASPATAGEGEEYWTTQLEPLVMQMTHRKNDYGTILSFLKSVNPATSPLVVSMREAEKIPREVGRWFIVVAEERAVVRLGIGTNPGLKKYYWRANGSKRLLKREMEDDGEPADLVYIIQKAHSVSKRCVSLPDDNYWLVMYLPSTLRAAKGAQQLVTTQAPASNTPLSPGAAQSSPAGPSAAAIRKRKRSAERLAAGPSTNNNGTRTVKKVARKLQAGKKLTAAARRKLLLQQQQQQQQQEQQEQQDAPVRAGKRQRRDSLDHLFKLCEPYAFQSASKAAQEFEESEDEEDTFVDILADDQDTAQSVGPSAAPLDPPSEDEAFFADLFGEPSHDLLAAYAAPPPTTSKAVEPDPFLPLAGSQTGFSAAIEAACMSGSSSLGGVPVIELPFRILPSTVSMFEFDPVFA